MLHGPRMIAMFDILKSSIGPVTQASPIGLYIGTVPYEGDNFANSKMDNFSLIID